MILAGDVGGTNTRLALFNADYRDKNPVVLEKFHSQTYKSLDDIVQIFINKHKSTVEYACFGVAGPVISGHCKTPNLAWDVDASGLAALLKINSVELINDLEANAYGIDVLGSDDFSVIHKRIPEKNGNAALISAGTGLGEAGLYKENQYYNPIPSEGGHTDFAPRNKIEIDLLLYLFQKYEHVSYERIVSGPGLYNIYMFLRDTGRGGEPQWLAEQLQKNDPAAVISKSALERKNKMCEQALDIFVSIYGAEAGNVALKFKATGGIYLGGGIAPKIIQKLKEPVFYESFVNKGRMKPLLESIPVKVILNDTTALLGAAALAHRRSNK
ncbi:MAG: glucokinase [Candidatus Schekmanbacteria bacterium RBG_13_48_7]|uniref:Glucokinase n=1 Tax=Candidatus Schekmanbacteria bacterium RBG_13_48_7 TaxID=1817878 RepID=A0A1F7RYQ7_9BACT|nr:MAG: glucokinase [Candidatus Schekmanbacteria bacterium RBG_13_48_7]